MVVKEFHERAEGFNEYKNHLGETVRIDPTKAHNLLCLLEAARDTKGDIILVYDGEEGSSKSTQGRQDGKFLDYALTEKRIEFNPSDAKDAHFKGLPENWEYTAYCAGEYDAKPWEVIILDESAKLDRKRTMSTGSVDFTGFLTQSRQLHKIFIIILPNVHMLDGYIAEHRAVALIHCYKHQKTELGFYKWYTRKHLKQMFNSDMHRQKLYPQKAAFSGRATAAEAFDVTEYNRKKAKALNAYRKAEGLLAADELTPAELKEIFEREALHNCIILNLSDKPIYTALNIPKRTWHRRKKAMQKEIGLEPGPKNGSARRALDGVAKYSKKKKD